MPMVSIPTTVAQVIAEQHDCNLVVIVGVRMDALAMTYVSWGDSVDNKSVAARLSDTIIRATNDPSRLIATQEDFRHVPAAKSKSENDRLRKIVRAAELALGSLLAVRAGLTDEFLRALMLQCQEVLATPYGESP